MDYNVNIFSKKANQVIAEAQSIATSCMYDRIGTEHLLIALVKTEAFQFSFSSQQREKFANIITRNSPCHNHSKNIEEFTTEMCNLLHPNKLPAKNQKFDVKYLVFQLLHKKSCKAYIYLNQIGYDIETLAKSMEKLYPNYFKDSEVNMEEDYSIDMTDNSQKVDTRTFAENMNLSYIKGKYDKCVNRDKEINRICEILMRKAKNNPVLIGKAGVGKTAIVEGLVEKIVNLKKQYPNHPLGNKIILNLNLSSMIAGTKYRGEFEKNLMATVEIAEKQPVILFIDEIHMITDLNGSSIDGTTDMAQMLKQPLSRGIISVIGATTDEEYKKIAKDKALNRRFSPIFIKEFSVAAMDSLLPTIANTYEKYHNVIIPKNIISDALKYCDEFYETKTFPDTLIDIIDETAARINLNNLEQKQIEMTSDDIKKTIFNQIGKIIL